jgi:hypothetical protein
MSYTPGGEYDIYTNTCSGHLYKRVWTGSAWTGWGDMDGPAGGGSFVGSPYALQYGSDMYLFDRDNTGHIQWRAWIQSTQTWTNWAALTGSNLTSDPTAVTYGSQLTVFANGSDGKTYKATLTPGYPWDVPSLRYHHSRAQPTRYKSSGTA